MLIIEINALDNGAHNNQTINESISRIPDGWAVVPESVGTAETLENFPFGEVEVEEINGVMTVTKWTAGTIPEPEPESELEPTQLDRVEAQVTYTAMMTDTLLEV